MNESDVNTGKIILNYELETNIDMIYRPSFKKIVNNIPSSFLLTVISNYSKHDPIFFKFVSPTKHELYKKRESWCEILNWTPEEFNDAFSYLGKNSNKKEEKNLVWHWIDKNRVPWYELNQKLFAKLLCEAYS